MRAVFLAAISPDGSMPGFGRLPCPYCGDLHLNPEDGSSLWTLFQAKALAAMQEARVCGGCGNPSTVFVAADNGRSGNTQGVGMLTAETITDEQIRELQKLAQVENDRALIHHCRQATSNLSLGYAPKYERDFMTRERRASRARCAEILNARNVLTVVRSMTRTS